MTAPSTSKRRWSELSAAQRAGIVALGTIQLTLQTVALRDLKRRRPRDVRGPKAAWAAASFINFAGPIAYLRWGRR